MNRYEERQEAKRERYQALAEKNDRESESRGQRAHDCIAGIPPGQPILVGHHSEKRHRAALNRHDGNMRKAIEADDKAAHYRDKAASVGKGGISSDDPEAIQKLQTKIDAADKLQETMKAANKIIRRKLTIEQHIQALQDELHFDHIRAHQLLTPDFCGRIGFAAYELQNNNANIRRMKQRIDQLKEAPTESSESQHGDVTLVENVDENRIQLIFPGKPSDAIRTILKRHGFRWSRYNGAWQRHLNNAGRYAADQALGRIKELQ